MKMEKQEILNRIKKAEDVIESKLSLIERLEKRKSIALDYWSTHDLQKEQQKVESLRVKWLNENSATDTSDWEAICGADKNCKSYKEWSKAYSFLDKMKNDRYLGEDIDRNWNVIHEKQELIKKYKGKLVAVAENDNVYSELPTVLTQVEKKYAEIFYFCDKQNKRLTSIYNDNEIRRRAEKDAKDLVLNLWHKVKEITGKVTETHNLVYASHKGLGGYVVGENGVAKVETIVAGGYNIQRKHLRMLVHKVG